MIKQVTDERLLMQLDLANVFEYEGILTGFDRKNTIVAIIPKQKVLKVLEDGALKIEIPFVCVDRVVMGARRQEKKAYREWLKKRQDGKCKRCGRELTGQVRSELHQDPPLGKGGIFIDYNRKTQMPSYA